MQFLPKLNADTYKTLIYGFKNQINQFPWWVEKKSEFGSVCNSILEVILRGTFYPLFLIYTSLQIAQGPFVCLFKFFWLKTFLSYAFYDHFKGKEGETFSKGKRTEIIHEVGIVILFKRISSKDSRDYFTHWRRVVQPLLSWTHEIPWPFVRQTAFLASELEWAEGLGCNSEFTREKWK